MLQSNRARVLLGTTSDRAAPREGGERFRCSSPADPGSFQREDLIGVAESVLRDPAHEPFVPAVRGPAQAKGAYELLGPVAEVPGDGLHLLEPRCQQQTRSSRPRW